MPLVVLPAHLRDFTSMYWIYLYGTKCLIRTDPLYRDGVNRTTNETVVMTSWSGKPEGCTVKCVDTNIGEIVGMASWDLYWQPGEQTRWQKPQRVAQPGTIEKWAESAVIKLWNRREKLCGKRRHIYRDSLGVHPYYQHRGVSYTLMRWGLDVADKLELPTYVECSDHDEVSFNERMGFEVITDERVIYRSKDTGMKEDIEVTLIVKMPSKAQGMSFREWADKGYPETYT
ncbi:acyl-CoA N-acyltransferase [Xylariaceae sp. FL0662B]|nr:acyl-CoA N-acyltransferase [Xylariaceae sp. FL0662B]